MVIPWGADLTPHGVQFGPMNSRSLSGVDHGAVPANRLTQAAFSPIFTRSGVNSGDSVTLQLVASTVAYAQPRLGGSVRFEINVVLPTVTP